MWRENKSKLTSIRGGWRWWWRARNLIQSAHPLFIILSCNSTDGTHTTGGGLLFFLLHLASPSIRKWMQTCPEFWHNHCDCPHILFAFRVQIQKDPRSKNIEAKRKQRANKCFTSTTLDEDVDNIFNKLYTCNIYFQTSKMLSSGTENL